MPKIRTTSPSIFSKRLTALRKDRQLTQVQLADELDLSLSTIAYYESAAKNPKLETIYKLAEFFAVSPAELIIDSQENKKPGPLSRLEQQLERIKKLSPAKQRMVSDLIEVTLKSQ